MAGVSNDCCITTIDDEDKLKRNSLRGILIKIHHRKRTETTLTNKQFISFLSLALRSFASWVSAYMFYSALTSS